MPNATAPACHGRPATLTGVSNGTTRGLLCLNSSAPTVGPSRRRAAPPPSARVTRAALVALGAMSLAAGVYLGAVHQGAPERAMHDLRRRRRHVQAGGPGALAIHVLGPCFSTPGLSFLHGLRPRSSNGSDLDFRMLECQPRFNPDEGATQPSASTAFAQRPFATVSALYGLAALPAGPPAAGPPAEHAPRALYNAPAVGEAGGLSGGHHWPSGGSASVLPDVIMVWETEALASLHRDDGADSDGAGAPANRSPAGSAGAPAPRSPAGRAAHENDEERLFAAWLGEWYSLEGRWFNGHAPTTGSSYLLTWRLRRRISS